MNFKKIIAPLLVLSLTVVGVNVTTKSAAAKTNSKVTYQQLESKYGLKDVKSLPKGVQPIVINSPEELDKTLSSLQQVQPKAAVVKNTNKQPGLLANLSSNPYATDIVISDSKNLDYITTYRVYANISISGFSGVRIIDRVNSISADVNGYTVGYEITNTVTSSSISFDQKSVTINAASTFNGYLFLNGLLKLYSRPISHSFTYNV